MKRHKFGIVIILAAVIVITGTACKSNQTTLASTQVSSASSSIDLSNALRDSFSGAASSETPSTVAVPSSATVIVPVMGISLSKTKVSLEAGGHTMPIVTMLPKSATNKGEIWESSNTKVATVNKYGSITAIHVGSCTVTVTSASNRSVSQKVSVTVTPKPAEEPVQIAKPVINTAMDARAQNFGSSTSYLILVDLANQKVGIYRGSKGSWNLSQSYICSSGVGGDDATPTGTFTIHSRGTWFFSRSEQMGAEWWTQFSGDYLFHSLPMDQNRNVVDATLGKPASHGCIRLSIENAKWIYNNVPRGTTVNIY
ncbi:MAG TPA: L,D-transpeptidase family protein [Clostridia bacterium]|nr:L,D-transpeptidase family protein [Clostridia bacterium]